MTPYSWMNDPYSWMNDPSIMASSKLEPAIGKIGNVPYKVPKK